MEGLASKAGQPLERVSLLLLEKARRESAEATGDRPFPTMTGNHEVELEECMLSEVVPQRIILWEITLSGVGGHPIGGCHMGGERLEGRGVGGGRWEVGGEEVENGR